jgi:hypothetical protein
VELNGALSNPLANHKADLGKLFELHRSLVAKAETAPVTPRRVPERPIPVLEIVTTVLELAGEPMPAREIYAAATELIGESIRWSSVKGILSAHAIGGDRRFRRIHRGYYELNSWISRRIEFLNPTGSFATTPERSKTELLHAS